MKKLMASLSGIVDFKESLSSTCDYPDFYLDGCAYRDGFCQPASEVIGYGNGDNTGDARHGTSFVVRGNS